MVAGARPKIIVSNDGSYGTIRLHQECDHPRRISATKLTNADLAAWGRQVRDSVPKRAPMTGPSSWT